MKGLFSSLKSVFARQATPAVDPKGAILQIVIPQARDRWLSASARNYTPETLDGVLRSAASGSLVSQWELFDLLEDTWPRLQKNLTELKRAVKALDWNIQSWARKGDLPTPEAQARATLLEDAIWTMSPVPDADENAFEATIGDIMDAWGKGIVVLEIDWEQRSRSTLDAQRSTFVAPRATRWIHPRYYGYPLSGSRLMLNTREQGVNISSLNPQPSIFNSLHDDFVPFPENKFLIAVCKHKSGHPIRSALLRPLAFWWIATNFGAEWLLNFAQIFGIPIRWATYDPNQSGLLAKVSEMLEKMGSAGWAAFPSGTALELKEASKSGQDNPQAYLINLAEKQCDILVLGQTLTTDAGDRGTQALGTVHQAVRADIIHAAADWVAELLNSQFVPALCRLNYGDAHECPWLMPSAKEVKDELAMAQRDEILSRLGVRFPLQYAYDRYNVPVPQEDEAVLEPRSTTPALPDIAPFVGRNPIYALHAKAADEAVPELVRQAIADAAGARVRWLEPLQADLDRLIEVIQDEKLTDRELVEFLDAAARNLPDLFAKLNVNALADSLEDALGAAALEGVRDAMKEANRR